MLSVVYSRAALGVNAPLVTVETHLSAGLPGFSMVGLPETAVKESKDRVRSAILNSHLEFPQKRITVNLAPADLPKEGGRYDLAIAIGILSASGQLPLDKLNQYEFVGELALSGALRSVKGAISAALACEDSQRILIAAKQNIDLGLLSHTQPLVADNLLQVCAHLHERQALPKITTSKRTRTGNDTLDLADVKGQAQARRALEVAAAGGHNLLFYGPPGTGKSMLASRLPGILPQLTPEQAIEVAALRSVAGVEIGDHFQPPFRSPHHTSSAPALVGGGSNPKPGEISLAHQGVLFLDELPEFPRHVLEVLREPIESGQIHISRANAQVEFPAKFQLLAAMNPCPCGYWGDVSGRCRCTPANIERYRNKISGPLLDRIDLQVKVDNIPIKHLQSAERGESSASVKTRVEQARQRQLKRQQKCNAELRGEALNQHCPLDETSKNILASALDKLGLSARAYDRIIRVARTLADLSAKERIDAADIAEALAYRSLDRPISG